MQLETEVNVDVEIPGMPEIVRINTLRKLNIPGSTVSRVVIEREAGKGIWSKINVIRLKGKSADEPATIDEVSEAIVRIMHLDWLEKHDTDSYHNQYKMTFEARTTAKTSATNRLRTYFLYRYTPGEEDENAQRMEDIETQWAMQAMEMQRGQIDSLTLQNQQLHETVIKLAELSSAPVNAAVDMFNQGVGIFTSGASMLVEAQKTQYSAESVRIIEEAKNKRIERVMGVVEKPLALMFGQFSTWAVKKWLGGDPAEADEKPVIDAEAKDAGPAQDAEPEHPLAMMFEAFGATITPKQRMDMNEALTKPQVRILDELFCAKSDEGALEAWDNSVSHMPAEKWIWLSQQLTDEQNENMRKARAIVQKIKDAKAVAKKKKKEEETE